MSFNKIISKFESWSGNNISRLILIALVCLLSYGLTLNMYFWKDDFAVMIKAANPEEAVGFLGPGIKGEGAYSYVSTPFIFLYPTFGMNAFWYFLFGLFLYFLSAVAVFYPGREIFKDNVKGLLISLIYSAGYIGADTIYGLMNSYQTSWITISLCFSIIFLLRYFEKGGIFNYIISIILFYFSLETGYVRAHGFFLIILSTVFLVVKKVNVKELFWFILKLIPFFLIFRKFYLMTVTAGVGSSRLTQALAEKNYDYFLNPFVTFSNLIFPTHIIEGIRSLSYFVVGKEYSEIKIYTVLGIIFIAFNLLILLRAFLKAKENSYLKMSFVKNLRTLLFGISAATGSFIGVFYIAAASASLNSTHRYLTTALIGLAFYWVSLVPILLLIFPAKKPFKEIQKKGAFVFSLIIIAIYLVLINIYNFENIFWRTDPQKKFFSQLKNHIPEISEKSFIYIDHSYKFGSHTKLGYIFGTGMVGGSPEISAHYNVDRYNITTSIGSFDDFISKYKAEKGNLENSSAFYFEDNNLINYTADFRDVLKNGKVKKFTISDLGLHDDSEFAHEVGLINENDQFNLKNSSFELNFPPDTFSLTNGILKFNLMIIPAELSEIQAGQLSAEDEIYLQYLLAKSRIKKTSKAAVLNHFQNQTRENLFDGRIETSWMADRGVWHNIIHKTVSDTQFIEITLDNAINAGGVLFTNGHALRTPTAYRILVKEDGRWKEAKTVENAQQRVASEVWFEEIEPVLTNKVRIEIFKTSSTDAPQLAEIELVDSQFTKLDFIRAQQIELDPAVLLKQHPNSPYIRDYFGLNGKLSFTYLSNKDNDYNVPNIHFNVKGLNQIHTYEISIPANGTNLVKAKFFNLNYPAKYVFSDFEFVNPPISYFLNKL